jgi:hypothetical protein
VHLVGIIIGIYYVARTNERQIYKKYCHTNAYCLFTSELQVPNEYTEKVSVQMQEDYLPCSMFTISVSDSENLSSPVRELQQASHRSKY